MTEMTIEIDSALLRELERLGGGAGPALDTLAAELLAEALERRRRSPQPEGGDPGGGTARLQERKTRFLSGLVHELRTPLGSVLMLAELLAENSSGRLTHREIKYAENIHQAASEVLALIADVGLLNRIEAGRVQPRLTEVAVAEVVEHLEGELRPGAAEKGLAFDLEMAPDLPPALTTDRGHLERIVGELIGHALRVTEQGGVSVGLTRSGAGESLALSVRDTGVEVAQDELETIFEPFSRSHPRNSRKLGGTGLGLTVARELARLLGGEIRARAEPRAVTVTLRLPLAG